jgi:hypothetical protein
VKHTRVTWHTSWTALHERAGDPPEFAVLSTAYTVEKGQVVLRPTLDGLAIDQRRAEIGLMPLAKDIRQRQSGHQLQASGSSRPEPWPVNRQRHTNQLKLPGQRQSRDADRIAIGRRSILSALSATRLVTARIRRGRAGRARPGRPARAPVRRAGYRSAETSSASTRLQPVERAWQPAGVLDAWVHEKGEWIGRIRAVDGRFVWIRGAELRRAEQR